MFKGNSRTQIVVLATAALIAACGGEILDVADGARIDSGGSGSPSTPEEGSGPTDPSVSICELRTPDVSSSRGWSGAQASQPALGSLRFEVMARPAVANADALVAVGGQEIAGFADAAIAVRFAEDGYVDVRDGDTYESDLSFGYDPGVWYRIVVTADVDAQVYDVEVGGCGEPLEALISAAAFRSDASVSDQLTNWAAWSSGDGQLGVSVPTWTVSGSCAPTSCESLGSECGQPSDGCDAVLSCGDCGDDETCSSGVCIDAPMTLPPPEPPGPGPGGPSSSCGLDPNGFCCEEGLSFSSCGTKDRYVRTGGGGRQDGSDWANAMSGLPSTLERDAVYWVGAGSYGSYTFDDAASGELGITVRKATAEVHGTDTGWSAAYGSGQATFGPLRFESSRYTLDGGEPNGLRAVGQMGTKATVHVGGSRIVLRYVEIDGGLQKSNGRQTAGGCNGGQVEADYVVFDHCEVHNVADDGLGIYADHIKVLYSKIHNLHGCGTDNDCGPCYNGHSDGLELSNVSDIELVGNMVYDVRSTSAIFMEDFGSGGISNLVAYNNVFYTPTTGITVYLKDLTGAKLYNNIIWGKTQGNRYGGLAINKNVTGLEMYNNIILNINYSHLGASHDPSEHHLDYNLFGMINTGEYSVNTNDLVGDPQFAGIPMSSSAADHKGSNLTLEDFIPGAAAASDTGTVPSAMPPYDVNGEDRPQGAGWDRGPFEGF